uniref:Guanylate kinase-like domain-containing protein n=1 Tax=Mesocestoides corti TaxID=53468 RepID=A0A5K3G5L2_MESCO
MAADIVSKEFLEYGQFRNILYGTRLDSVRAVMASGRMPVLDVEPKALRILRSAEFAPVVILISPPCLSLLIRDSQHDIINDSLAKLTRESEIMEYVYRPYIDQVVVHHNVEDSTQAIIDYVTRIQMGERWVPISWIY